MRVEEERAAEVGARIKALRGPKPQPVVADEIGVTLRAYQRWEAGGGLAWENLQRVAEVFGVSENYILYGDEKPIGPQTQLDRMERMLEILVAHLPDDLTAGIFEDAPTAPPVRPASRTRRAS